MVQEEKDLREIDRAPYRVAIVGLPNSGKSQLFNELTGAYTLVANYPLTTLGINHFQKNIKNRKFEIIDTPGLHGLYLHSEEEIIVRNLLFDEAPDCLIQCVDAGRFKQSLLLTLDLIELDIPLIMCLTAVEESLQRSITLDTQALATRLGIDVLRCSVQEKRGIEQLKRVLQQPKIGSWKPYYGRELEAALDQIQTLLPTQEGHKRKKSLLLFEGDKKILQSISPEGSSLSPSLSQGLQRVRRSIKGNPGRLLSQKRQQLVAAITEAARFQGQRTPGRIALIFSELCRHPIFGLPILAFFLFATYLLVVNVAGIIEQLLSTWIVDPVTRMTNTLIPLGFWNDLLIGDYGLLTLGLFNAFVTVLPILTVFFLILGFLEDIGYLPNLSVLARRLLGKFGLSGKSVMSLILGFGCKTMATLTTKGIPSRKEKYIAIYLIAFAIPCSAQLAINMSILGRVGFTAFLIAFGALAIVEAGAGLVLNKIQKEDTRSDFIQELPPIRLPSARAIIKKTGYRLYWFLKEAVPIFLIAAVVLFALDRFGVLDFFKSGLKPIVVGWLGLPLDIVEVLILTMARHEAAAGLLLNMVDAGAFTFVQSIVAVVITTMFVPCFANIVAMCKEIGVAKGIFTTLVINASAFVLAGCLNWILLALRVGV